MKKVIIALVISLVLISLLVIGIYKEINIVILIMLIALPLISGILLGIFIDGIFIDETYDKNIHYKFKDLKNRATYETKYWYSIQNLEGEAVYLAILTSNDFDGLRYFELPTEPRKRFVCKYNQMIEVKYKVTSID